MRGFLEEHITLRFTQCFRLSEDLAAMLGRVWKKQIKGVNECCKVEEMDKKEIVQFLSEQNPADILCLGARTGAMADTLNSLEKDYPDKILQFLQPLIAVKDWKGKFVLFLILLKLIGIRGYQNHSNRTLF